MSDKSDKGVVGCDDGTFLLTRNKDNHTIHLRYKDIEHTLLPSRVLEISYKDGQIKVVNREARLPLPSLSRVLECLEDHLGEPDELLTETDYESAAKALVQLFSGDIT